MSNATYPKFKERCLGTGGGLATATVKVQLVDTAMYTYSALHDFYDDIPVGARVGAPVTLTGVTILNGVFDADDPSITGLTGAPTIEALAIFVDTGTESTSYLAHYIDTATGLPTASGATTVNIVWDNGANKIAKL